MWYLVLFEPEAIHSSDHLSYNETLHRLKVHPMAGHPLLSEIIQLDVLLHHPVQIHVYYMPLNTARVVRTVRQTNCFSHNQLLTLHQTAI